jgi:hypothetical protein
VARDQPWEQGYWSMGLSLEQLRADHSGVPY